MASNSEKIVGLIKKGEAQANAGRKVTVADDLASEYRKAGDPALTRVADALDNRK